MEEMWLSLFLIFNLLIIFNDLRFRLVPNRLLLIIMAMQAFWMTATAFRYFPALRISVNWSLALIGLLISLFLFYPLWRFRAVGAGDVKFIAVLGFCLGPVGLFPVLLLGSVLAGLHSMALVMLQGWTQARAPWWANTGSRRGIPYAAYLAVGALFGVFWFKATGEPWLYALLDR